MNTPVISSTREELPLSKAPSTIFVVDGDQLRKWGIRRISELIERLVPGAISAEDFDDIILSFRGISADSNPKVLLLFDGHDYNTQWNNGPSSEAELGMIDDIARVEVLIGPHTAVYGASALLGVINIIPKSGKTFEGITVNGNYGGGDFRRGGIMAGHQVNEKLDYFLSAGGLTADGYTNNHNDPLNLSRFPPSWRFYSNVRYGELDLMSRYTRSSRAFYIQPASDITPNVWTNYDTFFLVARRNFQINEFYKQTLEVSYDSIQTQRHDFTIGTKLRAIGEDRYTAKVTGFFSGINKHQFVWGGLYRRDEFGEDWGGDNFNFTTKIQNGEVTGIPADPYSKRVLTPYGRNAYALFGQDSILFNDSISLLLGFRYDRVEAPQIRHPDSFSPRIALVVTPTENWVLKAMFTTGVSRQLNASATSPDPISFGNPTVSDVEGPEQLNSIELAASYELNPSTNFSINTFYNIFHDILGIDPNRSSSPVTFINAGRIDYVGFEAMANLNLNSRTFLRLIQQHVQLGSVVDDPFKLLTTSDNKHSANYPENVSKILAEFKLRKGLSINGNANLIWNNYGNTLSGQTVESGFYSQVNASVVWEPLQNLECSLQVYNLFNTRKHTPPYSFLFPPVTLNALLPERSFNVNANFSF